jgi:hypothetical protein
MEGHINLLLTMKLQIGSFSSPFINYQYIFGFKKLTFALKLMEII